MHRQRSINFHPIPFDKPLAAVGYDSAEYADGGSVQIHALKTCCATKLRQSIRNGCAVGHRQVYNVLCFGKRIGHFDVQRTHAAPAP